QAQRLFGHGRVPRRHGGHLLTHVAHGVDGQRVQVLAELAPSDAGRVAAGENGVYARQPSRPAEVNTPDAGGRVWAAQDLALQQSGQLEVGRVLARASDLLSPVDAGHSVPNDVQHALAWTTARMDSTMA